MRTHKASGSRGRRDTEGRPGAPNTGAAGVQLPLAAGNRATAQMLQRLTFDEFADVVSRPGRKAFEWTVWAEFLHWNRALAKPVQITSNWVADAMDYAMSNPGKGDKVKVGIRRKPRFWLGGPLIALAGPETHAITLDRDVFFNPASTGPTEPSLDTYVHELVHVWQYDVLGGPSGFLGDYLTEFLGHWVNGKLTKDDTDPYHKLSHEKDAKAIEDDFAAWIKKRNETEPSDTKELKEIGDLVKPAPARGIKRSVGEDGANEAADVEWVRQRLTALGYLDRDKRDIPAITEAIMRYQSSALGWRRPDGRVDPGGKTAQALAAGRRHNPMRLP